jgi:uncharacterized phage protein gp47/JayE
MPFARPTLPTIIDRIASDIGSRLPGALARLRRAFLTIIGRAYAGAVHGLYGHQEWIAKQILIDTCDADVLARHAAIWKVPRKAATAAIGPINVTGTDGEIVSTDATLTRGDGTEYVVTADAVIAGGIAIVQVAASVSGTAGDAVANTALTFVAPIAGISVNAVVGADGIGGGADIEDVDAWRARVVERIQQPPQGGVSSDYEEWALSVPGVTRAWVYPKEMGLGTMTVRFVTDGAPGGLIPDEATVAAVQAKLEASAPADVADIYALAPIAVPQDFEIHLVPDTSDTRAAVAAELADLLARNAIPGGTVLIKDIEDAVDTAASIADRMITVPAGNIVETTGNITTMGVITWV